MSNPIDNGISLRDWFAGQALAGLVGVVTAAQLHSSAQTPDDGELAKWAYSCADAMLEVRKEAQQ
jgi:hypothetical protein